MARPTAVERDVHDQEKDDPIQVDGVLSDELLKLSFQDRNDFQEEIHGVRCLAPKETPLLLQESLEMLQWELDHQIPSHEKQAYLRSQHPPLHHHNTSNNNSHLNHHHTYVNTNDFRLRFLRSELFDVPKAALRMVRFLDICLELFGETALRRPIRLSDFTKQELKHLRKGKYQFLPYRDRGGIAGRRIIAVFPDEEWESIPPYLRNKILMYWTWVAGNDVDVQREGLVFLVWFDKTFKVSKKPAIQTKDHETISVRAAAVHCCSPDTPLFRFRRSILTMRIGRHNRTRLNIHLGESVELLYKLNAYGIASDQIPITYAGKIKVVYLKQWLHLRRLIEDLEERNNIHNGSSNVNNNSTNSNHNNNAMPAMIGSTTTLPTSSVAETVMIESPYLSDIIFRKGSSLVSHAGNTALRTLVVTKARRELLADAAKLDNSTSSSNSSSAPKKTGQFVEEIIRELRHAGQQHVANGTGKACRFLVWNDGGWWEELLQEHEIHTRVEYIARGIRNTVIKNHRACSIFASAAAASGNSSSSTSTSTNTTAKSTPLAPPKTLSSASAAAAAAASGGRPPLQNNHNNNNNNKPTITTATIREVSPFSPSSSASSSRATTPDLEPRRMAINTPISPLTLVTTTTKGTTKGIRRVSYNSKSNIATNNNSNSNAATPLLDERNNNNNNLFLSPLQNLNGGTSIFRSLDHSSFSSGAMKKRRLVSLNGEESEMASGGEHMCEAECFGMKFNSTKVQNGW